MEKISLNTKGKIIIEQNQLYNKQEIIKCIQCNEIPIIKIFPKNNYILIICLNHQNKCNYSTFLLNCSFKCPNCFKSENIKKISNFILCGICQWKSDSNIMDLFSKCLLCNNTIINYYCQSCRKYLCANCRNKHEKSHNIYLLSDLFLQKNEENLIEYNIRTKEEIINNIIKYINTIPIGNKFKGKGEQLLVLLEEKKKEILIEKIILMNYKKYNRNYFALINAKKLLQLENDTIYNINLNQPYNEDLNFFLNYIRSYLQNGYKHINSIYKDLFTIKNFKDNQNIHHIHNKNIKAICALNESLIISGSWDCFLKIYNVYINQIIYSIEQPSMIFNLKKYPLIHKNTNDGINNHGILVCLYCKIVILNIKEKNSEILGYSKICEIKGFGNFQWTSIILKPSKKIISACLDNRLSAYKLLPNDTNTNEDIKYCLIKSNLNKDKETITSLLQIDENNFVSSSSLDLNDDPSIKFWKINDLEDEFILEKTIYDVYCAQYPNSICKINNYIIGFALEYASLRGKMGGIALIDFRYKEIFSIVKMFIISCFCPISENRFFTCGYDKNSQKRFLKEFYFQGEFKEIGSLELYHYDDIINIEIIKESELMVVSSDEGKITILDKYSY